MKKVLSLVLVLCLMASVSAFAGSEVLQGYVSSWDNYGLDKDPITLTIGCGSQDLPASYENNIQIELIKQATGVQLEFVGYDAEKFAVLSAGGDLPDIFSLENATVVNDLIDSGKVLDMAPYLEEYGKNITQVHGDYGIPMAKSIYGNGEAIYFVPSNVSWLGDTKIAAAQISFNYFPRWDLYTAVGAPEIIDEDGFSEDLLLEAFAEMQAYAREKTGDDNIYALSGWVDWGTGWAALLPYCVGIAAKLNMWTDQTTGLVTGIDIYGDPESHYYDALRFYNKAWRMGILDPEIFTLTQSQYDAKVKMGQVIVTNASWFDAGMMDESVKAVFGDDTNFYVLKGMPYFYTLLTQSNPSGFGVFASDFISAKCEYPERAVALIDYLRSDEFTRTSACGLQGIHWDYNENGTPVFIGEALEHYNNGTMGEYWDVANGNYKYFPNTKLSMASKVCADGYPSDFTTSADYIMVKYEDNESVQNYLDFHESDARYPGELYLEWIEEGLAVTDADWQAKTQYKPASSDEMNSLLAKCDAYYIDNHARVVFANTEEEAEAIIAEMCAYEQTIGSALLLEDQLAREAASLKTAEDMGL